MAESKNTGTVIQSWVSPKFAREIRESDAASGGGRDGGREVTGDG